MKKLKGLRIGKEKNQVCLVAADMILYIKAAYILNPKTYVAELGGSGTSL